MASENLLDFSARELDRDRYVVEGHGLIQVVARDVGVVEHVNEPLTGWIERHFCAGGLANGLNHDARGYLPPLLGSRSDLVEPADLAHERSHVGLKRTPHISCLGNVRRYGDKLSASFRQPIAIVAPDELELQLAHVHAVFAVLRDGYPPPRRRPDPQRPVKERVAVPAHYGVYPVHGCRQRVIQNDPDVRQGDNDVALLSQLRDPYLCRGDGVRDLPSARLRVRGGSRRCEAHESHPQAADLHHSCGPNALRRLAR